MSDMFEVLQQNQKARLVQIEKQYLQLVTDVAEDREVGAAEAQKILDDARKTVDDLAKDSGLVREQHLKRQQVENLPKNREELNEVETALHEHQERRAKAIQHLNAEGEALDARRQALQAEINAAEVFEDELRKLAADAERAAQLLPSTN